MCFLLTPIKFFRIQRQWEMDLAPLACLFEYCTALFCSILWDQLKAWSISAQNQAMVLRPICYSATINLA